MSLEKISAQIKQSEGKLPPVHLWDPDYCGEIDLEVKADGSWFYNGTIFKRMSLVKLLASVLKKEADDYFLVTPVEKIKISVEQAPFVLTQWRWADAEQTVMAATTNLDDELLLDANHPLTIDDEGNLLVEVRAGLKAKVHRNVYYQWIDLAKEITIDGRDAMAFESAGEHFVIGFLDQ